MDNAKKCELACLQNCSCSAYAYSTNSSSSGNSILCSLWYGDLLNIQQLGDGDKGNDLYIRLAPSQDQLGSRMKPSTKWTIVSVVLSGTTILKLEGKADIEELNRAFRVACWCIQAEEIQRPSMGQVVQILEGLLEVNPPPIQRYLQAMMENEETTNFFSE
ncbi:hypothetical protein Syun_010412 [Stephania yunnanensis]|uniref:Apple domain-containing protein n=1 Tax=Stephania yunnanensis TaxID=152371 RepID=A0AAP0KI15_9MAGN